MTDNDNVPAVSELDVERLLKPFRDDPPDGGWRVLYRDPDTGGLVDADGNLTDPEDVSPLVAIYEHNSR